VSLLGSPPQCAASSLWLWAACVGLSAILPDTARAAIAYAPEIRGLEDENLRDELTELSQLFKLKDKQPDTASELRQRAEADIEQLLPAVQGAGYWEARLDLAIDETKQPAKVIITVVPGPLYTLKSYTLVTPTGGSPPPLKKDVSSGLEPGAPAKSAPVLAAQQIIVDAYAKEGRPFAKVADRKVVIDRATHTMTVTYVLDAGPSERFGPTRIMGLSMIDKEIVERRIKWRRGADYDADVVETTRKALLDTGLFSTVRIDPATATADQAEAPMTIALTERAPRSVGAGANYDTNLGLGGHAFWEHRNLFGAAEDLRLSAEVADHRLAGLARLKKPDFLATDQNWVNEAELAQEKYDPYDAERLRLLSGIDRQLDSQLRLGAGIQVEAAQVTQRALFDSVSPKFDYVLLGLPLSLHRDTTDDQLNPTRGNRETLTATPYTSLSGADLNFVSFEGRVSGYQKIGEGDRFVTAGYAALGSIVGARLNELPADKRLYLGGGGSVRAYGFQRIGPDAPNGLPTGGISSLEFGVEMRIKITESIGVVPFLEAGNVYKESLPHLADGFFYGGGVGFRYYTPIGPLRLDIAVPFRKRSSDQGYQLYVSIGQAF
jgi:translocation and assembly module TamA